MESCHIYKPCHIYKNLGIFKALTYLILVIYSEPSQIYMKEFSAKIVKNSNHFSKALHFGSLTWFLIR